MLILFASRKKVSFYSLSSSFDCKRRILSALAVAALIDIEIGSQKSYGSPRDRLSVGKPQSMVQPGKCSIVATALKKPINIAQYLID